MLLLSLWSWLFDFRFSIFDICLHKAPFRKSLKKCSSLSLMSSLFIYSLFEHYLLADGTCQRIAAKRTKGLEFLPNRWRWDREYLVYEYTNGGPHANRIEMLSMKKGFGEAYKPTSGRRKFIRVGWYMSEEDRRVFEGMSDHAKHAYCKERYRSEQRKLTATAGVQSSIFTL
eukprot:Rmarinus@m.19860